jgi:hypothetical protein
MSASHCFTWISAKTHEPTTHGGRAVATTGLHGAKSVATWLETSDGFPKGEKTCERILEETTTVF